MSAFIETGAPQKIPAPAQILQLAGAFVNARCLHVVAKLGVADHVTDAPQPAVAIAKKADLHADSLHRVLRLLAMSGIFVERDGGWAHTEASALLRSDHPQSMSAFAQMLGDDYNWRALGAFEHTLRTGECAGNLVHPKGPWGYYQEHQDDGRVFDAAMTAKSHGDIPLLLGALDVRGVNTIADIAGGRGHFLRAILDAHPSTQGILYDQADVVAAAQDHPRMRKQAGDFFTRDLPQADLYLMTHILHDWNDEACVRILSNLRVSAPPHARLAVYELALPAGPEPHPAKHLDVLMLAAVSGRERTAAEYAALFASAGWRGDGFTPTPGAMAVHWAKPA